MKRCRFSKCDPPVRRREMKAAVRPVERGNEGQLCLLRPKPESCPTRAFDGWVKTLESQLKHTLWMSLRVLVKPSLLYSRSAPFPGRNSGIPSSQRRSRPADRRRKWWTPRDAGMMLVESECCDRVISQYQRHPLTWDRNTIHTSTGLQCWTSSA